MDSIRNIINHGAVTKSKVKSVAPKNFQIPSNVVKTQRDSVNLSTDGNLAVKNSASEIVTKFAMALPATREAHIDHAKSKIQSGGYATPAFVDLLAEKLSRDSNIIQ